MQNVATELTQRLLRSLDSNYNVINLPEVVKVISLLEKVAITKELLETTRLGKYVNEVRRKTLNEELRRRGKELVKKWRSMLIPEANGQMKTATQPAPLRATSNKGSPPLQCPSVDAKVNSFLPRKANSPVQARMVSPGVQRLAGSGAQPNRLVSPQMQQRFASPQARIVSPGSQAHKLVNLTGRMLSPGSQAHKLVNPTGRMLSPGSQAHKLVNPTGRMLSPGSQAHKLVNPTGRMLSPGSQAHKLVNPTGRMLSPALQAQQSVTPHKMVSPGGQRVSPKLAAQAQRQKSESASSPPLTAAQSIDISLKNKKRQASEVLDNVNAKRSRLNGTVADLEISDSSSSSFKDVLSKSMTKPELKRDAISLNSDSNSSFAERTGEPHIDQQIPKKRGRKKGSKNHKNLLDEAETSFTNKLAVSASRGGSKVKTTQEILAGIQNKNTTTLSLSSVLKPSKEDLEEKAAKLTERVSIIDRKLNANAHRNKNSHKSKLTLSASKPNERVIESGSVINDKSLLNALEQEDDEDDVVIVDDAESAGSRTEESQETDAAGPTQKQEFVGARSLSIEEALAQLPPIDMSVLDEPDPFPPCTCRLKENKPKDFSICDDEEVEELPPFEMIEDPACPAKRFLATQYKVDDISESKIQRLHEGSLPNVNGNWSLGTPRPEPAKVNDLYVNIVPHIYERLDKDVRPLDSFKKYSVSEGGGTSNTSNSVLRTESASDFNGSGANACDRVIQLDPQNPYQNADNSEKSDIRTGQQVFREWYECIDRPSYNDEPLRILPYSILD